MIRKPGFAGILHKCNDWDGFKRHVSALSQKEKGNAFEVLTKYYLQLDPKYTTQLKRVWSLGEVPSKVRKHLNLPGPDEGIDLVAESKEGEFWAVQCKYREDETKSLTRKELSTFTDLAFNICDHISLGLVCTNAERFSHKLALYGDRLTLCHSDNWRALDTEFFHCLHELLEHRAASIRPFAPFPYQRVAVDNAYQHFMTEGRSRGKLIMPCGTGKSLTSYWIAEALKAQTILVAVPSLALIRQTVEVWARESVANRRDLHWIAVCSDESVAANESDDISFLTQDLGIRVYSDPGEIARWLEARQGGTTVVFSTYQSGRRTAEGAKISGTAFDLGIFDEAHKTVGKMHGLFSYLLDDENVAMKKRIFMTATERHYRGESDNIVSMSDPNLYGDTFQLLSFKQAVESDPPILTDYKVVTIVVTREEIASLIELNLFVRPDRGKWDEDVEAETLAALIALRKSMQKHPIKHAVSFHSSVARARAFANYNTTFTGAFPAYGTVETYHVSGKTPTSIRSRRMKEFAESERSLVTNARCLTEGVDVPKIDCVLFADPKRSKIDIVQAVGRALRKADGKQLGYVIVPVLSDHTRESINGLQDSGFDSVLSVLRALAANDERIIDYFRTVSQGRKWAKGQIPFEVNIPDGRLIDSDNFIHSIELKLWPRLAKLSWRPFDEAREFVRALGLRNQHEWRKYCRSQLPDRTRKPEDIPTDPHIVYKEEGWRTMGDWLGTGTIASRGRKYRMFEEARAFVRSLKLSGDSEWKRYCKGESPEKGIAPRTSLPILRTFIGPRAGSVLETGWELVASLPDCDNTELSRKRALLSEALGSKAVRIGEDTAKANCARRERNRQIFRPHPGTSTKTKVGSTWEIGWGRERSPRDLGNFANSWRLVNSCAVSS